MRAKVMHWRPPQRPCPLCEGCGPCKHCGGTGLAGLRSDCDRFGFEAALTVFNADDDGPVVLGFASLKRGRWKATRVLREVKQLGSFDTEEQAVEAIERAAQAILGWRPSRHWQPPKAIQPA